MFTCLEYRFLCVKLWFNGYHKPTSDEAERVVSQVTFIYKSFERQYMAKRLYHNIQKYYPGVRVIIADDSSRPLKLMGKSLTVVQLPFNYGLSYGLNKALEKVETPFTMRLDDDTLLTPSSNIHGQLSFLEKNPNVDLVAVQACSSPYLRASRETAKTYFRYDMKYVPKPLLIPHKTRLDDTHIVLGKVVNLFLVRTAQYKKLGYDDNIRMIDHHEFLCEQQEILFRQWISMHVCFTITIRLICIIKGLDVILSVI